MKKITSISDTHSFHKKLILPGGDFLVFAGDMEARDEHDLLDFCTWLDKQGYEHIIVIGGNHDGYLANHGDVAKEILKDHCTYLENSGCEIDGVKFWGSPYTPIFGTWWFMEPSSKLRQYWDMIPEGTDVVITHGPPYGILDVPLNMLSDEKEHVGCRYLLERIRRIKPKLSVFGHIHFSYGTEEKFGVKFINASICNEEYDPDYKPVEVELL